jgi:hypothetical protein
VPPSDAKVRAAGPIMGVSHEHRTATQYPSGRTDPHRVLSRSTLLIKQLTAVPTIEYAIFIVMVIVTIGFAWLWLIEQQKKRKRTLLKKEIERR